MSVLRPQSMPRSTAATTSASPLGRHLYESFIQARHCDAVLIFRHSDFEHRVCAHKVVLERTEYFRALFSGPLSTNHQAGDTVVVLDDPNITQEAVVACISFLYNDELDASSSHLVACLAAASHVA